MELPMQELLDAAMEEETMAEDRAVWHRFTVYLRPTQPTMSGGYISKVVEADGVDTTSDPIYVIFYRVEGEIPEGEHSRPEQRHKVAWFRHNDVVYFQKEA